MRYGTAWWTTPPRAHARRTPVLAFLAAAAMVSLGAICYHAPPARPAPGAGRAGGALLVGAMAVGHVLRQSPTHARALLTGAGVVGILACMHGLPHVVAAQPMYRNAAGVVVLATAVVRLHDEDPTGTPSTTLDGRTVWFQAHGLWRWQALTVWAWLAEGAYFLAPRPIADVLFAHVLTCALFVSFLVSWVLLPGAPRRAAFQQPTALLMHNANVMLLMPELYTRPRVAWTQFPWTVLFMAAYMVWHHVVRFHMTRTMYYHILNWQHPHRLLRLLGLFALLAACFAAARVIARAGGHAGVIAATCMLCCHVLNTPPVRGGH